MADISIEFDDEEELMENPLVEQFGGMKFSDLLGIAGLSREKLEQNPDQEPLKKEDFDNIIENMKAKGNSDMMSGVQQVINAYQIANMVDDLLKAIDSNGKSAITIDAFLENSGHVELKFTSSGVG